MSGPGFFGRDVERDKRYKHERAVIINTTNTNIITEGVEQHVTSPSTKKKQEVKQEDKSEEPEVKRRKSTENNSTHK